MPPGMTVLISDHEEMFEGKWGNDIAQETKVKMFINKWRCK